MITFPVCWGEIHLFSVEVEVVAQGYLMILQTALTLLWWLVQKLEHRQIAWLQKNPNNLLLLLLLREMLPKLLLMLPLHN